MRTWMFAMEDVWAMSFPREEMATLLISASFAVNPHFSSSDGVSSGGTCGQCKRVAGKLAGWQVVR